MQFFVGGVPPWLLSVALIMRKATGMSGMPKYGLVQVSISLQLNDEAANLNLRNFFLLSVLRDYPFV
jgi:hypothetical protein